MKKAKEFIKNNKKVCILSAIAAVLLVILIVIICTTAGANSNKSKEKELTKTLKEIGQDFYENYWYDGLREEERLEVLERLSITGFHVDLDNLGRYNSKINEEKIKEFHNPKTGEECDLKNTKIVIYPNSPYGKQDYTLETVLSCGFEDKKDK